MKWTTLHGITYRWNTYAPIGFLTNIKKNTKNEFSTTSGSTGKPKILEYRNRFMGEFPVYEKDIQSKLDIFKLCGVYGCGRTIRHSLFYTFDLFFKSKF